MRKQKNLLKILAMSRKRFGGPVTLMPTQKRKKQKRRRAVPGVLRIPAPLATRGFRFPARPGERKAIDVGVATYNIHTTGSFTLLNGSVQGTDFNNRIGRKIICKSVFIRGWVGAEVATAALAAGSNESLVQQWRMIIFIDMQPNASAPSVTDLLVSADPTSQLNLNNRDRFMVVKDKTFMGQNFGKAFTAATGIMGSDNSARNVKVFKSLNLETIYNSGNAGTIADINSGALYMFWIGTRASGTTDGNAILSTRVRFIDP